jgi:serine/threonine protein kinase
VVDPGENRAAAAVPVGTTGELRQLGAGMTLGRYTLLRRIASGGMAEVYAARSQGISGFEKKVAIKKILPQYSLNRRFVDMLVDEAKITVSLTHPNIAHVYELGLEGDTYYIVMEYVDGRPLNRLLQKVDSRGHRTIPIEHTVHIMVEVTKGLHHAHNQRDSRGQPLSIVHRDVSPQNVLIAYTGDVKLIDFGIARAQGRAAQTSVGVIKGKLRYLAPEIARGDEPDHRADVFCCGIVLFELLTGEAMFAPRTDVEAIEMASQAKIRSPRASNPEVSADLEEIVLRALAPDREERYQTAKALYTDLRRFLNLHYPAYVGSELGDYMQTLFAAEMEEERRLDSLAEKVIAESRRSGEVPTQIAPAPSEASRPGYQQIVTRSELVLKSDQPDVSGEEEPARPLTDVVTLPSTPVPTPAPLPIQMPGPAPHTPLPTGVVPIEKWKDGDEDTARLPEKRREVSITERGAAASLKVEGDIDRPVLRLSARALLLIVPLLMLVGLLGLAKLAPSEATRTAVQREPAGSEARVPDDPPPPEQKREEIGETALLVLEVSPSVPVDVDVEGVSRVQGAKPPVRLEVAARSSPQRINVRAIGYAEKQVERLLAPGNESLVTVVLEPQLGSVVVEGLEDGTLTADAGRVDGNRVLDLPIGTSVRVKVSRSGAKAWSEKIEITKTAPEVVELPKAAPLAKGTLVVNSRPFSEVYVNDKPKGSTPLSLKLEPDTYKITLKRPDGQTYTTRSAVKAGKKLSIVYQWPR